jgi:hypothetical protein
MPGVGFEPTIPVFERAKTVHATVMGTSKEMQYEIIISLKKTHIFTRMVYGLHM